VHQGVPTWGNSIPLADHGTPPISVGGWVVVGYTSAWSVIGTPAHEGSKTCRRMAAQRAQHQLAAADMRAAELRFTAYGSDELCNVERFKYLGRVLSHDDNDVPAMRRNLKKARATWGRISKILTREEVPVPVAGMFYQAVVAVVLLYLKTISICLSRVFSLKSPHSKSSQNLRESKKDHNRSFTCLKITQYNFSILLYQYKIN
jgi:hypothetical protein